MLCAFDLIELDGNDLRTGDRSAQILANLLYRERDGIVFNTHYDGDGAIIYMQACALGWEAIVSKRRGSPYRSGRHLTDREIDELVVCYSTLLSP
jgi:bifunctional non-homologous end joining protein LigD